MNNTQNIQIEDIIELSDSTLEANQAGCAGCKVAGAIGFAMAIGSLILCGENDDGGQKSRSKRDRQAA